MCVYLEFRADALGPYAMPVTFRALMTILRKLRRCLTSPDVCYVSIRASGIGGRGWGGHACLLVPRVPFRAVLEAIQRSAFVASALPVIIMLDMHCGPAGQRRVAFHLEDVRSPRIERGTFNSSVSKVQCGQCGIWRGFRVRCAVVARSCTQSGHGAAGGSTSLPPARQTRSGRSARLYEEGEQ